MPLTIALSGMDTATETALRAAFAGANAQLDDAFALLGEGDAEHVIVDMDSMYGPMSWLRLHAAGKQIVGLTSAPRVQTHFRLGRPFDDQAMAALLREIAGSQDVALAAPTMAAAPAPVTGADVTQAAPPAHAAAADAAALTPELDAGVEDDDSMPAESPDTSPSSPAEPILEPRNETAQPFGAWLQNGALRGRLRYRRETGPTLWLDVDAQQYHGPSTLKPLSQYFDAPIERGAFEAVDDAVWAREAASAGAPQSLSRLVWLGGLLAGDGSLAPGYDPDARYQLHKWPQTEREYPRHFRIATAMMKGPATLGEIIAASGLPAEDVLRFVNANLATGYAEPVSEAPAVADAPERAGGFFSRLRRR